MVTIMHGPFRRALGKRICVHPLRCTSHNPWIQKLCNLNIWVLRQIRFVERESVATESRRGKRKSIFFVATQLIKGSVHLIKEVI